MNSPSASPVVAGAEPRGFWSLIVTQFQGAFSDNALKNLVIFLILGMNLPAERRDALVPLVGALFALPFIVFSMAGGYLADRYSKRTVTIAVKWFEIGVMGWALVALTLGNLALELTAVVLMGVHSAIWGPSKYGLLPELLPPRRLSWGNGVLELGTFLAIIVGTMAGGVLSDLFAGRQHWSGVALLALAGCGLLCSLGIGRVPAANPAKRFDPNFVAELWRQVGAIRRDRVLWLATIGNTYFFFLAALLQFNIVIYGKDVLALSGTHNSYLNAAVAIGIGLGSLAAGYLSGGKIEYGLIPLGSLGMTGLAAALSVPGLSAGVFAALLALLGVASGFFIVPVAALLQHRPARENRGGVLAAANLLSFVGVFLASGAYYGLATVLGLGPGLVFLCSAGLTLAGTIYVLVLLPEALLRWVLWMLTNTLYRIRVEGRANIPERGGALFVCNHLSLVDALLLMASTDRPIRMIMYKGFYERPLIKPFARILKVIPISAQLRPRELLASLRQAGDAIRDGEVVCIFAEGQVTRIGQMLPFRRGFERIMRGLEAPIIPVSLDGVWGSIFSFDQGRFYWKVPRRIPYPITVSYGRPLPSSATPFEVRQAVQELQSASWHHRKREMATLHRAFVATARRYPFRMAVADGRVPRLGFLAALLRTIFLGRRLRSAWAGQDMVGLLLPPCVPAALANLAALLMGKVPVNLNYTVSNETLAACIRQSGLRTVLTSRLFLEKVKLEIPCSTVWLEEVADRPRLAEKLGAMAMAWLYPVAWIERALGCRQPRGLDDPATVIFSSGSTGEPKGVVLTHYNIGSNIRQLDQVFGLGARDRLLGVLPFFHSFGFTGTLMLPAVVGVGVAFHPNPLEARAIGPLVRRYGITFLLSTPTFLQMYVRGCEAEDFGSLRLVMAGAEKLPERVAVAFEEKFGIRPLEGYGCTECGPAVAVNTHDFRAAGFRQVGAKRGKIGHPLPGMSVRIVDPTTREPLPVGEPGLLLVKGPNVMAGYLGRPDKTAGVLQDGWYCTGDVAALDEDGFLQITDRLSRFSKVGGEMVPHIKVEEKLHELAGAAGQAFVVAGVADDRKGERLVVLHTLAAEQLQTCLDRLPQSGLPNLWIPRANQFFRIESFPHLGSGKLDLRQVQAMARQVSGAA